MSPSQSSQLTSLGAAAAAAAASTKLTETRQDSKVKKEKWEGEKIAKRFTRQSSMAFHSSCIADAPGNIIICALTKGKIKRGTMKSSWESRPKERTPIQ